MLTLPGRPLVFVVRIRLESASDADAGSPVLHGSVQLLGTEPQRYFALLEALPRILQNMLDQADAIDIDNPGPPDS